MSLQWRKLPPRPTPSRPLVPSTYTAHLICTNDSRVWRKKNLHYSLFPVASHALKRLLQSAQIEYAYMFIVYIDKWVATL